MNKTPSSTIENLLSQNTNNYTSLQKRYHNTTNTSLLDPFKPPAPSDSKKVPKVSVVIPAWNAEKTIHSCLASLEKSSFNLKYQNSLEVIVVDDGSEDKTWQILQNNHFSLNLKAIKIKHSYRSKACNTGVSVSDSKILVFCDADMILNFFAIEHLVVKHESLPNSLLIGFRTNVNPNDFRVNSSYIYEHGCQYLTSILGDERLNFPIQGWPNNMCLASELYKNLGFNQRLWMPDDPTCEDPWFLYDQVFGALFSLTKKTFVNVGGYDEQFIGWGCEDSFLAAKSLAYHHFIIPIFSASGLHIKHLPRSGDNKIKEYKRNRQLLFKLIKSPIIKNPTNFLTQAKTRILDYFEYHPSKSPKKVTHSKELLTNSDLFLQKIDILLAIGNYPQVLTLLAKHAKKVNSDDRLLLSLARTLMGMDQYEKAINILGTLIQKSSPETMLELAIAQASNDNYVSSKLMLKKLYDHNPSFKGLSYWLKTPIENHLMQGQNFLKQGFYKIASRCFDAVLIIEPENKTAKKYKYQCREKEQKKKD